MVINYNVTVDDIEENMLIDASTLHYAQVQLKYNTQELTRKRKVAERIARIKQGEYKQEELLSRQTGLNSPDPDNWSQDMSQVAWWPGPCVSTTS